MLIKRRILQKTFRQIKINESGSFENYNFLEVPINGRVSV